MNKQAAYKENGGGKAKNSGRNIAR